jgi:23S rRNA pseudouridine2605 synthase
MLETVGHPVRHLHRSRYAELDVTGLGPGSWRELSAEEVVGLRAATRTRSARRR